MHNNLYDHHHHSPAVKWLYTITLAVSALAAIKVGLRQLGYNVMSALPEGVIKGLDYFVGICGVIGLVMIILCVIKCCSEERR